METTVGAVTRDELSRDPYPASALMALPGIRLATTDVRYQGWVFRGPARLDVTWQRASVTRRKAAVG
jgi:hypothetical protein